MTRVSVGITCGPSGSGKSTFYKKINKDFPGTVLICPDDIRKELTGDVNNQTKNKEVWDLAYKRLEEAIKGYQDVYFCATNCNENSIKTIISHINTAIKCGDKICVVELIMFPLTSTFTLKRRVKKDLQHHKDRSNTLKTIEKNGVKESVIKHQNKSYKKLYKEITSLKKDYYSASLLGARFGGNDFVYVHIGEVSKECLK